jgi:hypothetical protein
LFDIEAKSAIWTPEIGRLEIHPTVMDYSAQKVAITDAAKIKLKELAEKIIQEARNAGSFEEWYRINHDRGNKTRDTSGQFNYIFIMRGLIGKVVGNVDLSFGESWDDLNGNKEKRSRYEELYKYLMERKVSETDIDLYANMIFEGNNKLFSTKGKQFNLFKLKNMDQVVDIFIKISRFERLGFKESPVTYPLRSLRPTFKERNDIAELQKRLKELQTKLDAQNTNFSNQLASVVRDLKGDTLKVGRRIIVIGGISESGREQGANDPLSDRIDVKCSNTPSGTEEIDYKIKEGITIVEAFAVPHEHYEDYVNGRSLKSWHGYFILRPNGDSVRIGGTKQQDGRYPIEVIYLYK